MILSYERSGGFTGMRFAVTLDTETLPADEGGQLEDLVEAAGFFDLPSKIVAPAGADDFVHLLTVESVGRRHTVEASGSEVPPALGQLLGILGNRARRARGTGDVSDN